MSSSRITTKPTRGNGLLENLLARLRARRANKMIPTYLRNGKILDIGCGSFPYFLSHIYFREKFAIDRSEPNANHEQIRWHTLDLNSSPCLPFEDNFFSVVTMLAVIEHLDPDSLTSLFREVYRTLSKNGLVIITTPAAWSDRLLHLMAHLRLVSEEEIKEHVFAYTLPLIGWYFGQAGFSMNKIKFGYFEFFLNLWAIAKK